MTTKICKNCNWYRVGATNDKCYRPEAVAVVDVVTGDKFYKTCYTMRDTLCGPNAVYYDPKLSILQRIFPRAKPQ